MNSPTIKQISECFIKPKYRVEESKLPYYLSPWDLQLASINYGQEGLLFRKPKQEFSIDKLLEGLKDSLALTLVHFYPLAGQLVTKVDKQHHQCLILVDCNKGNGVKFTHAKLDLTISDLLLAKYVPHVVKDLFLDNGVIINYDGHSMSLFMVQVTELVDAIFLGMSINLMLGDGIAHSHLLRCWFDIYRTNGVAFSLSRPPIHKRWVPNGYRLEDLYIPYIHPDEFITRYKQPLLRERLFYFSSSTLQDLKAKANEMNNIQFKISSFQALLGHVWRSIVQSKGLSPNQITHIKISADSRKRLNPPLPDEYFGSVVRVLEVSATVRELIENGLGWVAQLLHKVVASHDDKEICEFFRAWFKHPTVIQSTELFETELNTGVHVAGSPHSKVYENELGLLGKPIAIRKGDANTFDGKVYASPGIHNEGVELGIWLSPDSMVALESDEEFMAIVSPSINYSPSSQVNCRL